MALSDWAGIVRIAVAVVLAVSAVGKIGDSWTLRSRMAGWIGRRLAGVGTVAVIAAEAAVAVGLVAVPTWPIAVATVLLLWAFAWVLAAQLQAGDDGECACFGVFGDPPPSWGLVARNVGLGLAGGWAAVATRPAALQPADVLVGAALAGVMLLASFTEVWIHHWRLRAPKSRFVPIRQVGYSLEKRFRMLEARSRANR